MRRPGRSVGAGSSSRIRCFQSLRQAMKDGGGRVKDKPRRGVVSAAVQHAKDEVATAFRLLEDHHMAGPGNEIKGAGRSEEHTSELQSLMRNSYADFCLKKKTTIKH